MKEAKDQRQSPSRVRFAAVLVLAATSLGLGHAGEGSASEPVGTGSLPLVLLLGVDPAQTIGPTGERISQRCPAGESRYRVTTADRKSVGTAWFCYVEQISIPFLDAYSAVVTVNLAGGSLTATLGSSLTSHPDFEGLPIFPDPSTGSCRRDYAFGGPEFATAGDCQGPVTEATGAFSGIVDGWLSVTWVFEGNEETGEGVWTVFPTITIEAS